MKVTLESTDKIVELTLNAYITRIAVHESLDASEFERDLQECRRASAAVDAIPLRLVL